MADGKRPWEHVKLTQEHEAYIYKDFGVHYMKHSMYKTAEKALTHSLDLLPGTGITLEKRSFCRRSLAKAEEALSDLREYQLTNKDHMNVVCGIDDLLYDLNRLEDAFVSIHNHAKKYKYGHKNTKFQNRLVLLNQSFNDSLGKSLETFFMKQHDVVKKVGEQMEKERFVDDRPLWKRLHDLEACDVQSVPDVEEEFLHPREIARRELAFKVYLQSYLSNSWVDIVFLKKLFSYPSFLLKKCTYSTPQLKSILCEGNNSILKFLKMLQTRSPMYNEYGRKCPNPRLCEMNKQKYLNVIQYQTRRIVTKHLRAARILRKNGDTKKLANFVETVMGDFVVYKTSRILPWKFEFMNEMYNILGLAFTDQLVIPSNLNTVPEKERLIVLLNLPTAKVVNINALVFGRKSTFQQPDLTDTHTEKHKLNTERLRKRLIHAKYPIERSYLNFEIARQHNIQTNHEDSLTYARKCIEAGKECSSFLYQFLGTIEVFKSRAALGKLEYLKEAFEECRPIVEMLKSLTIENYVQLAAELTEELLQHRIRDQATKFIKSKKSHLSMRSMSSALTQNSYDT